MRILQTLFLLTAGLALAGTVAAEETSVTVRALAHDAKLIPGVEIVIADADTNEVLARGMTEGGTGDTDRIVREPVARGEAVYATEGAAGYTAGLDLSEPRRVTITAVQASTGASASRTMWLSPGRDVTGNGVVLELYGLKVGLRAPTGGEVVPGEVIPVTAEVRMLCTCPVEPGGLWNADGFEVTAVLLRDGQPVGSVPLEYAGETSLFSGRLDMPDPGEYALRVLAEQPARGNFGVATTELVVKE